ncbi:sphingomyelin phosphodiesterase 2 isoform X2 [Electrophorus electricus]|nr:sphingomyelin phosphodiesterase 2 isoform X2 [Electrophorus electricus]XP_035380084.1 sphingomyelin phosphodiesterase 2 isoform X2 [Electrophorus electricus]XP_035380085.1 sphingomyelin phosphodiesterase 2 isoform X2 [Electrophorus electricus]
MIGDHLSKEQHDVVLLQEVWSEGDFLFLKKKLGGTHPFSYYFKSGFFGSGLAVFSRHTIHDAFLYKYSLNGYPYMVRILKNKILLKSAKCRNVDVYYNNFDIKAELVCQAHHGDWFGGKAVGKVLLKISGLMVHVFVTHLHAEYCREQDSYLPHRVVQAWELQNFIQHTCAGADVVILGGDLNMHPGDLGMRLLRSATGLQDCFTETGTFDGCEQGFTHVMDNPFTNKQGLIPLGGGIRIDYVFFKGSRKVDVRCESLSTTKGVVPPGQPFPYSDHEALSADLFLCPSEEGKGDSTQEKDNTAGKLSELVNIVTEARTEVKVGVHCAKRMRYTAARTVIMGLVLLILEIAIAAVPCLALGADQPFPKTTFYLLGALCFAVLLSTTLLYILYSMEVKALQETEDQMRLVVGSLHERLREFPKAVCKGHSQKKYDRQDPATLEPDQ